MTAPRSPWRPSAPDTPNVVPDPEPPTRPDIETASEDLLIERSDLGPGAHTLVKAGEPIPRSLADRPRRPVDETSKARKRR